MPVDILVPPLSQTMDSVVLVEWLVAPGSPVTKGQPLFVIETDKANLEVEAPASGVLQDVTAQPGSEVKVRSVIGRIIEVAGEGSAPLPGGPAGSAITPPDRPPVAGAADSTASRPGGRQAGRILSSPRARRRTEQEGVELSAVTPSGPQGAVIERDVVAYAAEHQLAAPRITPVARRVAEAAGLDPASLAPAQAGARITRADVEAALAQQTAPAQPSPPVIGSQATEALASPPGSVPGEPLSATRRTIGRRMLQSWQNAPQVTLTREVDATDLVRLREQILRDLPVETPRPGYTAFLAAIVSRCLKGYREINGTTDGERVLLSEAVNLSVAVDIERGLVVPVIRDAEKKGLLQLAQELQAAVQRATEGTAPVDDYQGGTFTLSNLGPAGIDAFTPIINPPQLAILGTGRIREAPAVHEGQLCVRHLMALSLTFDHRAIDGAPAARFLGKVAELIEKPYLVWL